MRRGRIVSLYDRMTSSLSGFSRTHLRCIGPDFFDTVEPSPVGRQGVSKCGPSYLRINSELAIRELRRNNPTGMRRSVFLQQSPRFTSEMAPVPTVSAFAA